MDGRYNTLINGLYTDVNSIVLREIEEEELKFKDWKEKNRKLNPSKDNGTKL